MKEVILKNWEGFESEISRVLGSVESKRAGTKGYVSDPLFRGHADERWRLLPHWSASRINRTPSLGTTGSYVRSCLALHH